MHKERNQLAVYVLEALAQAVSEVQPKKALAKSGVLQKLPEGRRRLALATGKAAATMLEALLELEPEWPTEAVVLCPHGTNIPESVSNKARVLFGNHPVPDETSLQAASEVAGILAGLEKNDAVLFMISGGTSALIALPEHGISLSHLAKTTQLLLRSGAAIAEVNCVRRELLLLGGGGMARLAHPAKMLTAAISDVEGDKPEDIGSGPTVPSPTTAKDALNVLQARNLLDSIPNPVRNLIETKASSPKEQTEVAWGPFVIIARNRDAVGAAKHRLEEKGIPCASINKWLRGEASTVGRWLGSLVHAIGPEPGALVMGGETTVTVKGSGKGGRNQELALAGALAMEGCRRNVVLASAGTDGIDGVTTAAGAAVDPGTTERIRKAGLDPETLLLNNDSFRALDASGDLIYTGPTGTNVCDLVLLAWDKA